MLGLITGNPGSKKTQKIIAENRAAFKDSLEFAGNYGNSRVEADNNRLTEIKGFADENRDQFDYETQELMNTMNDMAAAQGNLEAQILLAKLQAQSAMDEVEAGAFDQVADANDALNQQMVHNFYEGSNMLNDSRQDRLEQEMQAAEDAKQIVLDQMANDPFAHGNAASPIAESVKTYNEYMDAYAQKNRQNQVAMMKFYNEATETEKEESIYNDDGSYNYSAMSPSEETYYRAKEQEDALLQSNQQELVEQQKKSENIAQNGDTAKDYYIYQDNPTYEEYEAHESRTSAPEKYNRARGCTYNPNNPYDDCNPYGVVYNTHSNYDNTKNDSYNPYAPPATSTYSQDLYSSTPQSQSDLYGRRLSDTYGYVINENDNEIIVDGDMPIDQFRDMQERRQRNIQSTINMKEALLYFYETLSPEQKEIAMDFLMAPRVQ